MICLIRGPKHIITKLKSREEDSYLWRADQVLCVSDVFGQSFHTCYSFKVDGDLVYIFLRWVWYNLGIIRLYV